MKLVFEWDARKAKANLKKHRVSFEEAKTIFNDPHLITYSDNFHSDREDRFISIGYSSKNRILLTVHTERQENASVLVIRIISSRKATPTERKFYEED